MRILLWPMLGLFAVACGAAQTEEAHEANEANEVDEPEPITHAPPPGEGASTDEPVDEGGSLDEPRDEVAALEGTDLASAAPRDAGDRRRSSSSTGVARGVSAGGLRQRRSSMPELERRPERVAAPASLGPEVVEAVITEHLPEVNFCYESVVRDRPDIRGHIVVGATIAPSGRVTQARIRSSTINNARVDQCILRTFQRWEFPAAEAPTTVERPFSLGAYQPR